MTDESRDAIRSHGHMTRVTRQPTPAAVVPGSRSVPDLVAAIDALRRHGGRLASEIRTAPGIASWAFVSDPDGHELLLWQNAA